MRLVDERIGDLLDRVAAAEPMPAGGSVCGLVVASAAALVAMAARASGSMPDSARIAERADELRAEATALADADVEAYTAVLDARRSGDRAERFDAALVAATEVPLSIAGCAQAVGELAVQAATDGNPRLREDSATAALLTDAAARSAAGLVRANVAWGELNGDWVQRVEASCAALRAALARLG